MKKIYSRPIIKLISLSVERGYMTTDSMGEGDNFDAREYKYFDEDDDVDSKKNFWNE